KLIATLKGHGGDVNGIGFSPDGKTLYSGDLYKIVKVWDVATQKNTKSAELPGGVYNLLVAPDGKKVFVGSREPWVYLWNPASPAEEEAPKLRSENEIAGLAVTLDGKTLVQTDGAGAVYLWKLETGDLIKQQKHGSISTAVALSPDGKVFVTGGGDGSVKQWDAASGEAIGKFSCPDLDVRSLAYRKDGKALYVGLADGHLKVVDPATGAVQKDVAAHEGPLSHIAVSPDGKKIATCSLDFSIKLWPAP
ncbi:MAG TPA: PQQ-binding-like beta-propeller repeat protein, partial [Planctomycetota bacterium]|nr:PQQ-binding-like beta-propeller repeat protein [Planctomycetota bacterium]